MTEDEASAIVLPIMSKYLDSEWELEAFDTVFKSLEKEKK